MLKVILSLLIFPIILLGQNGPQIKFDHEQFDLGEIREGEAAEHVFNFTNQGEDTLRIINVYGN
jgi:hypothetical protein